jgi:hypothetical protein
MAHARTSGAPRGFGGFFYGRRHLRQPGCDDKECRPPPAGLQLRTFKTALTCSIAGSAGTSRAVSVARLR